VVTRLALIYTERGEGWVVISTNQQPSRKKVRGRRPSGHEQTISSHKPEWPGYERSVKIRVGNPDSLPRRGVPFLHEKLRDAIIRPR